jgi:acyl carrier protein
VEELRKKVEQMIIEILEIPQDSVIENNIEDVGINSLSYVRLIINIESEFGISVPDELLSLKMLPSIDDIVAYITINT